MYKGHDAKLSRRQNSKENSGGSLHRSIINEWFKNGVCMST